MNSWLLFCLSSLITVIVTILLIDLIRGEQVADEKKKPDLEKMVFVPAGEFFMGSDDGPLDERPRRKVYVEAFYIDKYEVTNEEYRRFNPLYQYPSDKGNHPVTKVTWYEAAAYAEWAGKRLPTEIEWEKAACGTDGRKYPWGDRFEPGKSYTADRLATGTAPVGSYPGDQSPYRVYDMAGNVREWTANWYGSEQQYKLLKGGTYFSFHGYTLAEDEARCAKRTYFHPSIPWFNVGFRCVVSSP